MLEVKRDVQQRMAAAMSLVDGVLLLAEEAVLECEQRELVTEDYKFGCHMIWFRPYILYGKRAEELFLPLIMRAYMINLMSMR